MESLFVRISHKLASLYYGRRYANIFQRDETRTIFSGETSRDIIWPHNNHAVCNLQFDDFCAKSKENGPYDFGGAVGTGINVLFDTFLESHPYVKTTLFVIPKPTFKNYKGIYYGDTGEQYNLSKSKYKNIITWLTEKKSHVEIACHGHTHIQHTTKYYLSPAEFEFMDEAASKQALQASHEIFRAIGIKPHGFRPPAWGIGENNQFRFLDALKEQPFTYVSLSSPYCGLNWSSKRVSNIYPQYYKGMLNIPQNISIAWDMERIKETIDRIVAMHGIITLAGHYNTERDWMEDGIGAHNMKKLHDIFDYMNKKYPGQIWHATLAEIADFWDTHYHEDRN